MYATMYLSQPHPYKTFHLSSFNLMNSRLSWKGGRELGHDYCFPWLVTFLRDGLFIFDAIRCASVIYSTKTPYMISALRGLIKEALRTLIGGYLDSS